MSHGLFVSSSVAPDQPILQARRTSRKLSIPISLNSSRRGSYIEAYSQAAFMNEAIAEARASLAEGGIPIGCVLVRNGQIVARGRNCRIQRSSPILHAEMACLEAAGRQPASFYHDCILYTTLSPCSMCAGAIRFYGIPQVVIGENQTHHGDEALLRASNIQVDVLDSSECHELLGNFVKENPTVWEEDAVHKHH